CVTDVQTHSAPCIATAPCEELAARSKWITSSPQVLLLTCINGSEMHAMDRAETAKLKAFITWQVRRSFRTRSEWRSHTGIERCGGASSRVDHRSGGAAQAAGG